MIPDVINFIRFRHFRYVNEKNKFIKVTHKIHSLVELNSFFNSTKYLDAYYSTSTWINPHKLGPRTTENEYETIFLNNDIFLDIDFKPFNIENIERARKEAVALTEYLNSKKIPITYIAFSGGKGFHISCVDTKKYSGTPLERELAIAKARVVFADEIEKLGIKIDSKITKDTRRIVRIPGTINSSTGYLCQCLSINELINSTARKIIAATPRIEIEKPVKKTNVQQQKCEDENTILSIKSNVCGTMRNIIVFQYNNYRDAKNAIKKLNEVYSISLIFLLKKARQFYVISPITLDKARILKIANVLSKPDYTKYSKYGYTSFPVDAQPIFFNEITSKDYPYSKAHLGFLEKLFNLKENTMRKLCGEEKLIMTIDIIE